jgi:thiamine-phosphate pyrophosphorylase
VTPIINLVTNGILTPGDRFDDLVQRVAVAAAAGVNLIQVRERALEGAALTRLVEACVQACRGTRARILVNDRVDVALAAGAHGVHMRVSSMAPSRVRAITPRGFVIGRSVHSPEEAAAVARSSAVDYFLFGTVFPSRSKPGRTAAGLDALAETVAATTVPVLAIGGVTFDNASRLKATGAAGLAAIDLFVQPPLDRLQVVVAQAALAFDTPLGVP